MDTSPGKEQAKHNSQRLVDIPEDDSEKMVDIFAHLGRLENNTQVTVNEEGNKKYGFLKDVELENGDKQETLVDTGATVSSISWDTAIKLNLHTFVTPTKCIEYGSGVTQTTRNKAILKFFVDGVSTRAFPYVVEKQNVEIILGMDWMVHEDWALRPRTKDLFKITESQNVQAIQTSEEKLTEEILKEFPSLIPNDDEVQTVTNAPYKHRIITSDALPVNVRDYRRPYAETMQIKKEVAEMLRKKVIEPSTSAWCSPVVLIKKGDHDQAARDGTPPQWRFCVDYRKLNAITVKDKFPIGNLNELLDQLHGCKYLSTIDLKAGYWQIPMDPRDAPKTAFIADGALYQFRVLPFGCVTAPNVFSRFMAGVMRGLSQSKVYLDDIIVFSPSLEAHKEGLRAVLSRLVEYNLKISVKKCKFFRREVEYLGFIVSDQGIRSNPAKMQVIKDWKAPTTVSALQRFLGFCAFYHRFIRNLAQMAAPLYKLLKKDIHFEWSKEANQAFEDLKKPLMTLPTLAYPDPTKPYDVHTDASMHGLGAVIVQDGRPVAFASRTLTPAEKNYSTTEQEGLCVVYALKHFYPYLYGAQLTIYTDHAALKSILSVKEPRGRIARWISAIQGYSFTIVHRKGILNADADALSRKDQVNSQAIQNGDAQPTSQGGDGAVQRLSGLLHLKNEQLKDATVKAILKEGVKHPFSFQDGLLWYKYEDATMVPVTPQSMVKSLIRSVHSLPTGGHFATDKALAKVRLMGWWSSMSDDVKNWVKNCDPCQGYKIRNDSAVPPMKPIVPSRLGEIWALDIAMLPLSKAGNRYLLVMCEYLSKWTITVALPSYDTDHIAQAILYELVLKFSVPSRLITDNGASLVGDAMNQVCARLGIKRSTSVEHPQTDGLVERMNRTLKTSLAAAVHTEPTSWDTYLQFITFAYNTAKHASTGFSPFHILFGRQPVLPNKEGLIIPEFKTHETETWVNYLNKYIPLLHGKVLKNIKVAQGYQKTFYDKGRRVKYDYKVGDLILRKNLEKTTFPKELWSGPYEIVSKNNEEGTSWKIVKKGDPRSYVTTANVRHMRPYYQDQDSNAADKSSTLFEGETM